MNLSFEVLLVAGIYAFFLYDALQMLYFNEVVFLESAGKWISVCPQHAWRIKGRTLYLPPVLFPDTTIFRCAWSTSETPVDPYIHQQLDALVDALRPLKIAVIMLQVGMLLALPAVLFRHGAGTAFLAILGLLYCMIIGMMTLVWIRRDRLNLKSRDVLALTFDSLACPPFALNLVRKISLRRHLHWSPIPFAVERCEPREVKKLAAAIQARLEEELAVEEENSPRATAVRAYHVRLQEITQ